MPTHDELQAEHAALRARLAEHEALMVEHAVPVTPFIAEQAGPATVPAQKTNQVPVPTPRQLAVVERLRTGRQPRVVDPAIIQDQIDSITTVIVSGVNSAGYGDKRTDFRSLSELRQILNGLEEALADALGRGGRIRQIRMTTSADKAL